MAPIMTGPAAAVVSHFSLPACLSALACATLQFRCSGSEREQASLVATVATSWPNQTALQRFLPTGPLALLPARGGFSSVVWSCPSQVGWHHCWYEFTGSGTSWEGMQERSSRLPFAWGGIPCISCHRVRASFSCHVHADGSTAAGATSPRAGSCNHQRADQRHTLPAQAASRRAAWRHPGISSQHPLCCASYGDSGGRARPEDFLADSTTCRQAQQRQQQVGIVWG